MTQKARLGRPVVSHGFCMMYEQGYPAVPIFSGNPGYNFAMYRLFQRLTQTGEVLEIIMLTRGYGIKAVFRMKEGPGVF